MKQHPWQAPTLVPWCLHMEIGLLSEKSTRALRWALATRLPTNLQQMTRVMGLQFLCMAQLNGPRVCVTTGLVAATRQNSGLRAPTVKCFFYIVFHL